MPIAALLTYHDSTIGRGFNTVLRDGNSGGHAEINAISDAIRHRGRINFDSLDREKLVLLTTFEPCAMCKGAIIQYRIKNVRFIEPKSLSHWLRDDLRGVGYELRKQRVGPELLQDSLFRSHPAYDPLRNAH